MTERHHFPYPISFPIKPAARMEQLPSQFFAQLVRKVQAEVSMGHDVINLGQGNPDRPTPSHIIAKLQESAENPLYHRYPPFDGFPFLKEAIAAFYQREYGVQLDPYSEVAILFGGKTGLVEISQCLLNPGDVCLVPDPGYPDYWSGVALAGARMAFMPLLAGNAFLPDYSALSKEDVEKAKLLFINYPNNPTGVCAPASFYEETIAFAARNNIVVASDFAYGAIGFDGEKPTSFLQQPGAKEVGIEFYTLSKTYNMAGWRVGFALGNPEVIRLLNLIQDHYYCSLFGGIQEAAAEALTASQQCVVEQTAIYQSRRDTLFSALERIGWHAKPSEGSFFAWLPIPQGYTSASLADLLLKEAKVVVAPGIGFGANGEGYIRMGMLTHNDRLEEAVDRIGKLQLY